MECRRVWVFRREPIVDNDDPCTGSVGQASGEARELDRRAQPVATTVEVHDDIAWLRWRTHHARHAGVPDVVDLDAGNRGGPGHGLGTGAAAAEVGRRRHRGGAQRRQRPAAGGASAFRCRGFHECGHASLIVTPRSTGSDVAPIRPSAAVRWAADGRGHPRTGLWSVVVMEVSLFCGRGTIATPLMGRWTCLVAVKLLSLT